MESPFVNKSPARRQIAFLPMKSSVPQGHTFKPNPSFKPAFKKKERPYGTCSVIGHPRRNGTKPGSVGKGLVWAVPKPWPFSRHKPSLSDGTE